MNGRRRDSGNRRVLACDIAQHKRRCASTQPAEASEGIGAKMGSTRRCAECDLISLKEDVLSLASQSWESISIHDVVAEFLLSERHTRFSWVPTDMAAV